MNERQREQVLDHVIHNIAFIPVSIELYNALYDSSRKQGNSSLGVVSTVAESLLWQYLEDMQEEYPAEKGRSVHWKDPNSGRLIELKQNTGYTVYRSPVAGAPQMAWAVLEVNATDQQPLTPGVQLRDTTGDSSSTGIWYYRVAPYDGLCGAEGPW